MRYDWDERKNLLNQRKHGISLELASLVFEDPHCLVSFDRVDEKTAAPRWQALGAIRVGKLTAVFIVAHAYREDHHGEEIIRIISARAAEKHEVRRYQGQAVD
jgi:uncharacterized protein